MECILFHLSVRFLVGGPFTEGPTVISATSSSSSQSSDTSHILNRVMDLLTDFREPFSDGLTSLSNKLINL